MSEEVELDIEHRIDDIARSEPKRFECRHLRSVVAQIFGAGGSNAHESERLAHYLVEANLAGHDSHGVIRVTYYVDYVRRGQIQVNQRAVVVHETDCMLVVDGGSGFGQVVGEDAMQLTATKCAQSGVCVVAIRNCGHLGRIGDWPMLLAQQGMASLHFVNTTGYGILVAPFGGIDRRLSANPIAAGIPRSGAAPIILDISTAAIAEGKLKVARNKGASAPDNCLIDAQGQPTNDPNAFYAEPPGAILAFGGHKGYGLGLIAEIMAGALTGSGCSRPGAERLLNGMLSIAIDPQRIPREFDFTAEIESFIAYVKSSRPTRPGQLILVPGELEEQTRAERTRDGVPLDGATQKALRATMKRLSLGEDLLVPLQT
ncbi:MAG TPA: malate/lactate/ureidoglycolate dehydrogenase [Lacipirellulaceae bacterium]|nr:malate/lactate/ureidoglycolate dehydrogenase [Lacipirellulaceae bacterium]